LEQLCKAVHLNVPGTDLRFHVCCNSCGTKPRLKYYIILFWLYIKSDGPSLHPGALASSQTTISSSSSTQSCESIVTALFKHSSPVNMSYYPSPHGYEAMPYMAGGGYGYDTGYPMPMPAPMSYTGGYDNGYYPSRGYYSSRRHYGHRRHHRHSYAPRVYYKHRTIGDRFMGMLGMPQSHLYRM